MRNLSLVFAFLLVSANVASAMAQEAGLPVQQAGIAPAWEVRPVIEEAGRQVYAVSTVLDKIKLERWPAAEQPAQRELLRTARAQINMMRQNFDALAGQPTRLSLLLDALTNLQSLVRQLDDFRRAVAKYQDIGLAIDLDRLLTATASSGEKLAAYARDLARFQEAQLKSLTEDVARCQQTQRERERSQHPRRSAPQKR